MNPQCIRGEPAGDDGVVSLHMPFDDDTQTAGAEDPAADAPGPAALAPDQIAGAQDPTALAPDQIADAQDPTALAPDQIADALEPEGAWVSSDRDPEYAAIGMDFEEAEWTTDGGAFDAAAHDRWLRLGILPPSADPADDATTVEKLVGRAVLRCRLYWGWSQKELGRRSGVDQTTISRLERGLQKGLSLRRLLAILKALRVADVLFEPRRPSVAPTALDLMLHGDPWERALRRADERVNRRRSA